jgi:hypothetical protein
MIRLVISHSNNQSVCYVINICFEEGPYFPIQLAESQALSMLLLSTEKKNLQD